ncbi:MAG: 2-dehydro-3-deoxygalactonokinase [Succinivibrionaceae bacterium]|nr:2-dehydro-3-deoxygalactonokinase [Succinivibrionaceae bacterium]
MARGNFIVIDWGSTNVRAYLYMGGVKSGERQLPEGVTVAPGREGCEDVYSRLVGPWLRHTHTHFFVLMAGMVGSVNGWADAGYLDCPADLMGLGAHLCKVTHPTLGEASIVPGICVRGARHDVIRGEETQILGAALKGGSGSYLMPGTHSKWVRAEGTHAIDFHTVMTGELHHVLLESTLVGKGCGEQQGSEEAFTAALRKGLENPAIVPLLFEVRAARILGGLPPEHTAEALSGLLIGAEVAAMRHLVGPEGITVIAGNALTRRYCLALDLAGIKNTSIPGDTAFINGAVPLAAAIAQSL